MIKTIAIIVYIVINLNAQTSMNNSFIFISMIIDFNLKYICINKVIIYD